MTAPAGSRPSPLPSASPSSSSSSSTLQSTTTRASSLNGPSPKATPGTTGPKQSPQLPSQTEPGGRLARNQGYGTFGSHRGTLALAVRVMARRTPTGQGFSSVVLVHSVLLPAHHVFSGCPAAVCGQDFGHKPYLTPDEVQLSCTIHPCPNRYHHPHACSPSTFNSLTKPQYLRPTKGIRARNIPPPIRHRRLTSCAGAFTTPPHPSL